VGSEGCDDEQRQADEKQMAIEAESAMDHGCALSMAFQGRRAQHCSARSLNALHISAPRPRACSK
ncbi:MAG: hypothetical protein AAF772_20825, partial [Acidobacteriota bacterium]